VSRSRGWSTLDGKTILLSHAYETYGVEQIKVVFKSVSLSNKPATSSTL